jgi:hypothetical protein
MPQAHLPADAIGLPISREQIEQHIDVLIDLLNTLDTDPDLEPDLADASTDREGDDPDFEPGTDDEPTLGWRGANCFPENDDQASRFFHINADSGRELEDDGGDLEPDVDDERNLGWANEGPQTGGWSQEGLRPDFEGTSPEWPAVMAPAPRPTGRKMAELVTVSAKILEVAR